MLKALIVEDEPLMRGYLMTNLNQIHKQWSTCACARDGVEALALLKTQIYDLVISDIKMPEMDGIELALYIRHNYPDTDVILLTGYDEFEYARSAVRAGVFDYLLKPLQDLELHQVLQRLAEKRLGASSAPEDTPSSHSLSPAIPSTVGFQNPNLSAPSESETEPSNILIDRVRDYIQQHYAEPLSLNEIADRMHINPAYLSSIFKSERGESYSKYILRLRMERAALLLRTHTAGKISDIAKEIGYVSPKHFDAVFKKYYGMTPKRYQEQAQSRGNTN